MISIRSTPDYLSVKFFATEPEKDIVRLSPLLHKHINVLGHYSFTLAEQVINGQLRPLNLPSDDMLIP